MNDPNYSIYLQRGDFKSLRGYDVVIDVTLLLRDKSVECLNAFRGLGTACRFHVTKDFRDRVFRLTDSIQYQSLCSGRMVKTLLAAWECMEKLNTAASSKSQTAYRLFKMQTGKKVFATGNETEALRHILNDRKGDILLVTDEQIMLIREKKFRDVAKRYGNMEPVKYNGVSDPTGHVEYCDENGGNVPVDGVLSADGSEGVLFQSGSQVLKCYYDRVPRYKSDKLRRMMEFAEEKPDFTWPKGLVFENDDFQKLFGVGTFSGFLMDYISFKCSMKELCGYKRTAFDRWQLAANFTAQVLYLYLHDIQLGDYNQDNFGIQDDLKITFMDVDSYIVGQWGTQVRAQSRIPYQADYTKKADVIQADYYYLHATVFSLLTDFCWPYYFAEENAAGTYVLHGDHARTDNVETQRKDMPYGLRQYFARVLDHRKLGDPFELYERLWLAKDAYQNDREQYPMVLSDVGLDSYDDDQPRRAGFWARLF